jgi:hypothetical protein
MQKKSDAISVEITSEPNFDIETPQHKANKAVIRRSPDSDKSCFYDNDDRGWTEKSNGLVLEWLRRCTRLIAAHNSRIQKLKRMNIILTVLYIVLNASSSSLAFMGIGNDYFPTSLKLGINVFIAISNLFTAVLAGVNAFLKIDENIEKEKYAIAKFSKLIRDLEIVVYTDIEERPVAKKFLSEVSEKYYKYQTAGDMVGEIIEDWKKKRSWKMKVVTNNNVANDVEDPDDSPYIQCMKEIIDKHPSRNSSTGQTFPKPENVAIDIPENK